SVRVVPDNLMSWLDSTVIGLAEVRFGCGIREPVMTMSPAAAGAACAFVGAAGPWLRGCGSPAFVSGDGCTPASACAKAGELRPRTVVASSEMSARLVI